MAISKPIILESDIWAQQADPGDIEKPGQPDINSGFLFGEKPPHSGHNYYWKTLTQFIVHLSQQGIPLWDAETTFDIGSLSKQGSKIYQAQVPNQNVQPGTDPGIWLETSLTGIPERGGVEWQYAQSYRTNDLVVEILEIYIARRDNSNRQPSQSPDDWKLIIDLEYYDQRYVLKAGDTMNGNLNVPTLNGGVPWTSANHGAGSGLDADKLDGMQPNQLPISDATQSALNMKLNVDGKAVDSDKLDGMEPIDLPVSNPTQGALNTKPTGSWSFDGSTLFITIA
jgi:hypothetical protein